MSETLKVQRGHGPDYKVDRIPSKVTLSSRSGFYVATVYGPAPYGGSLSLAFNDQAEAWAWVAEREAEWQ